MLQFSDYINRRNRGLTKRLNPVFWLSIPLFLVEFVQWKTISLWHTAKPMLCFKLLILGILSFDNHQGDGLC